MNSRNAVNICASFVFINTHIATHKLISSIQAFLPAGLVSDPSLCLRAQTLKIPTARREDARAAPVGANDNLCKVGMQRDSGGLAKTNYIDLMNKWECGCSPRHTKGSGVGGTTFTHTYKFAWYLDLLQSVAGWDSNERVRNVPDLPLVVAVLSSLWEKHTQIKILVAS